MKIMQMVPIIPPAPARRFKPGDIITTKDGKAGYFYLLLYMHSMKAVTTGGIGSTHIPDYNREYWNYLRFRPGDEVAKEGGNYFIVSDYELASGQFVIENEP